MNRKRTAVVVSTMALSLFIASPSQAMVKVGTSLISISRLVCGYADCLSRGSWVADLYGWPNPGTLPVGTLPYVPHGVFFSEGEFFINVGQIKGIASSGTMTVTWNPLVFQINGVKATAGGDYHDFDNPHLTVNYPIIRLLIAADLSDYVLPGLSVGVQGGLPIVTSKVRVDVFSFHLNASRVSESRDVDVTVGAHYRAGYKDWFMVGAYVNGASFGDHARTINQDSLEYVITDTNSKLWDTRFGFSVKPAHMVGAINGQTIDDQRIASSPLLELATEVVIGFDWEHFNSSVPGEGTINADIFYFGLDFRVVPDQYNPLSNYVRLYGIGGYDSAGGYGFGPGLYGNGPLQFLSFNGGYRSEPVVDSIAKRADFWAASASVTIPFDEVTSLFK